MVEIEELRASVLDALERGFWVLACTPKDKSPMGKYSINGVNSATNDPETACRPYADGIMANYGVACGKSGLTVVDYDHGFKTIEDYETWRQAWNIPETFTVISGRQTDELGIHAYYSGETATRTFEKDGVRGDLKSKGGYVVGPGSIHPSGKKYYIYKDAPIVPLPKVFEVFSEKKVTYTPKPKLEKSGLVIDDTIDWCPELIESFLDAMGLSYKKKEWGENKWRFILNQCIFDDHEHTASTEAAVLLTDDEGPRYRCQHATCSGTKITGVEARTWKAFRLRAEQIAGKHFNFKTGLTEVSVAPTMFSSFLSSKLTQQLELRGYPLDAWEGTLYKDYADLSTKGIYIPKEFFIEALKTVTGAVVADRLSSNTEGVSSRFYTIFIAESGSGKGTAITRTLDLFSAKSMGTKLYSNLLWKLQNEKRMDNQVIGCQVMIPASEVGLSKAVENDPHILISSEEFESFFSCLKIPGSGGTLAAALRGLKDTPNYTPSRAKDRNSAPPHAYVSILGGATEDIWEEAFVGAMQSGTGFYNRFNIIGNQNKDTVAILPYVNLDPIIEKLRYKLDQIAAQPIKIEFSVEAVELLNQWFSSENVKKSPVEVRGRLNLAAIQNAMHMAWLLDDSLLAEDLVIPTPPKIITASADIMKRAIEVADYQLYMRHKYRPIEGNDDYAAMENKIRQYVKMHSPIKMHELKRLVHYERSGLRVFNYSLENIQREGVVEVAVADNTRRFGKNSTTYVIWHGDGEE